MLVDIRPQINPDREGGLPGAVVIDRNVLDWRLDPASDARLPIVVALGQSTWRPRADV